VLLTLSKGTDAPLSYSQLWHYDHDDTKTIKLFAYLTDVSDDDDGPFTFLPAQVSSRFGFSIRSHRHDCEVLSHVRPHEVVKMTGPRLSTFMVETSRCLHMGSRLKLGHSRLLYTATFTSAPAIYPRNASRFRVKGDESPALRMLLSN